MFFRLSFVCKDRSIEMITYQVVADSSEMKTKLPEVRESELVPNRSIPAEKLHTVAVNMACDEELMANLNYIDGECLDIRTYRGRINEIKDHMLEVFERVHQEMEDRSIHPEYPQRVERSRSPRLRNRASIMQAIRDALIDFNLSY